MVLFWRPFWHRRLDVSIPALVFAILDKRGQWATYR